MMCIYIYMHIQNVNIYIYIYVCVLRIIIILLHMHSVSLSMCARIHVGTYLRDSNPSTNPPAALVNMYKPTRKKCR